MNMTTGDLIALAAVGLNGLFFLSGIFKLNATVATLKELMTKFERSMENLSNRLHETEGDVRVLKNNCLIYHAKDSD